MQADAQRGHPAGSRNRVARRRRADHQACSRKNAAEMRRFHRVVDFLGGAEIVSRDDQPLQAASFRVLRKWKNSTPSRRRRFIISGLAIISATMEAILDGRK